MPNPTPDPWSPPGFDCNKCGKCCRNFGPEIGVRFLPSDVARIAKHLSLTKAEFYRQYLTIRVEEIESYKFYYFAMESKTKDCPFVLEDETCGIHEVKPEQCIRGPYGILYPTAVSSDYDCAKDLNVPENWDTRKADQDYVGNLLFVSCIAALRFIIAGRGDAAADQARAQKHRAS